MKSDRAKTLSDVSPDTGLTLVEVLAAVIIIVIVSLSAAGLSINGIKTASAQERQQVAVTIANGAMENVSGWAVTVNTATGVSSLYTGRYSTPVAAAFAANSSQPGVSQTYPASDPTATGSSTAAIPITATTTQNGTAYTTNVLIGTCYEPVAGGTCGLISGYSTAPPTAPAGYIALIRVIVLVSWTAGSTCSANGCYYETTTLDDPDTDLTWVSS